ncbi:MAG: translocation/assembly module TamB domain-containing protein, partial [Legionellales bacterium]|nr:translocation/assembly module TamB domain-containing protein [Legionellales bacterium]
YLNKKNFNIKANVRTYNNLINYYIHPLKISSPLSFNLHYTAKDNALIKADLNFMSKNIVILSKFGEQVSIKEASLSTKFKDNSIFLLAKITSDNNNETILKLNYDNTNLSSSVLKRAKISGSLNSTYNDHRFMDSLINSIDDIKGNFQTQIDISGTLQSPLFNGFSKFDNGSIFVSPLFLKIFDINYHLKINNNNFTIIGGMNSGKGNIKIDGNGKIENLDISKINFQVDAKNFRIYDTNNIILDINSALYISKDDYLQLKGNIDIINGSITIESFPDVESLSSDIVVDTDPTEKNTTPLFYDIDVNISDKIKLSAYKITGNLDGKLRLVNNNIYSDAVLGNINIKNGNFIFFNNLLKINKGEILYAGTSIDNPDIDLKASTKILSMSNTIEEEIPKIVGVQATGRIYSPEIQLFAVPAAFSDEDILSYLAFGKSTRQISGNARTSITSAVILLQGSDNDLGIIDRLQRATGFDLDISTEYSSIPETQEDLKDKTAVSEKTNYFIGKQITPKLKVSIGYSKSANKDAEQIFRATYNLTRRWQLALERKSELDTALRILYNIEFWE